MPIFKKCPTNEGQLFITGYIMDFLSIPVVQEREKRKVKCKSSCFALISFYFSFCSTLLGLAYCF